MATSPYKITFFFLKNHEKIFWSLKRPREGNFTFFTKIIALNKKKYRPWAWLDKGIPVHYGPWGEN